MARAALKAQPILADDLQALQAKRGQAEAALSQLIEDRKGLVLEGSAEDVVENDGRQVTELARVEQCDSRIALVRVAMQEASRLEAQAAEEAIYQKAVDARADGVDALAKINELLTHVRQARLRLVTAKRVVAAANHSLHCRFPRIEDPEGNARSSILDIVRIGHPSS